MTVFEVCTNHDSSLKVHQILHPFWQIMQYRKYHSLPPAGLDLDLCPNIAYVVDMIHLCQFLNALLISM